MTARVRLHFSTPARCRTFLAGTGLRAEQLTPRDIDAMADFDALQEWADASGVPFLATCEEERKAFLPGR